MPAMTVAANPVTELSADPFKVKVNPRPVFPAIDPALTVQLEEIPVPASETCQNIGEIKGFRLTLLEDKADAKPELLHEDTSVPASRGCPPRLQHRRCPDILSAQRKTGNRGHDCRPRNGFRRPGLSLAGCHQTLDSVHAKSRQKSALSDRLRSARPPSSP